MAHGIGQRTAALIAALALLLLGGCASASSVLVKLPAETIPKPVRDAILARDRMHDVVWRGYVPEGSTCHVAYTYTQYFNNQPVDIYTIEAFNVATGEGVNGGGGGGSFTTATPFYGSVGSSFDHITGYSIGASGVALSPRVKSIRGTTLSGTTITGNLINGFWWLDCKTEDGADGWAEIAALDDHDTVIYKLPGLPPEDHPAPPPRPPKPLPEGVTPVKLAEIPASQIPEAIRGPVEQQSQHELNVVWRVCKTVGNRTMTVYTYDLVLPDQPVGKMYKMDVEETVDGMRHHLINGGDFSEDSMFHGSIGSEKNDSGMLEYLDAHGFALDAAIARVRGLTRSGLTVETGPIDGFWLLVTYGNGSGGEWQSIEALDASGKVLYEMRIPATIR